jgi:RNA polymerase sigma-70 factor (ECF subfamily)
MSDAAASDSLLAVAAAAGDERAFALLVGRHKEPLYRLLRRYTGDADEAYEVVHEAFIAAWSALGRYDPGRPLGAWLRAIALNKARDRGRRLAVRRAIFGARGLEEPAALATADPAATADERFLASERRGLLDRAIADLPSGLRAPLVLTAFDGCSQEEAGAILGVSAKTIETRVHRARKRLAERLEQHPALGPKTWRLEARR